MNKKFTDFTYKDAFIYSLIFSLVPTLIFLLGEIFLNDKNITDLQLLTISGYMLVISYIIFLSAISIYIFLKEE